jgi:hypothetical protein
MRVIWLAGEGISCIFIRVWSKSSMIINRSRKNSKEIKVISLREKLGKRKSKQKEVLMAGVFVGKEKSLGFSDTYYQTWMGCYSLSILHLIWIAF